MEFADILIKKLEKVKREQELDEKLNRKLAEDAQSMVSQGSNRSLADILREKLIVTDDFEGDQSILDDHVSRIWTDKTPLRSPGEPSGRPRSPGYSRSSRPLASLPPRLSSSVTMGSMGPPGAPPRRAVQTAGKPRVGLILPTVSPRLVVSVRTILKGIRPTSVVLNELSVVLTGILT